MVLWHSSYIIKYNCMPLNQYFIEQQRCYKAISICKYDKSMNSFYIQCRHYIYIYIYMAEIDENEHSAITWTTQWRHSLILGTNEHSVNSNMPGIIGGAVGGAVVIIIIIIVIVVVVLKKRNSNNKWLAKVSFSLWTTLYSSQTANTHQVLV